MRTTPNQGPTTQRVASSASGRQRDHGDVGGVAGGLFASFQGFVSPESFSLMESVMVLCMVVLGGMGHIGGVILGAILLTLAPEEGLGVRDEELRAKHLTEINRFRNL